MIDLRRCKQCGFQIVSSERNEDASKHGFCSDGCEDVYQAIKEQIRHEAEKDAAREEGL